MRQCLLPALKLIDARLFVEFSQMKSAPDKITLIGAGLNGPLLAILLMQRGFAVEIYERRPDMRRECA